MTCLDRVRVRAVLVVIGLVGAGFLLWDGEKLRGSLSDEPPGQVRIGAVVRDVFELYGQILRSEAEIKRLRAEIEQLDHAYRQPRL